MRYFCDHVEEQTVYIFSMPLSQFFGRYPEFPPQLFAPLRLHKRLNHPTKPFKLLHQPPEPRMNVLKSVFTPMIQDTTIITDFVRPRTDIISTSHSPHIMHDVNKIIHVKPFSLQFERLLILRHSSINKTNLFASFHKDGR